MISKTLFTAALCAAAANAIRMDAEEDYELESAKDAEPLPMDQIIADDYPELTADEVNELFADYF